MPVFYNHRPDIVASNAMIHQVRLTQFHSQDDAYRLTFQYYAPDNRSETIFISKPEGSCLLEKLNEKNIGLSPDRDIKLLTTSDFLRTVLGVFF